MVVRENPRFGELFGAGRDAVLAGRTRAQVPPVDGGGRWGLSVVLRPEGAVTRVIDEITWEAMSRAGYGHWPTGAAASSHVTVRGLEHHRSRVPEGDGLVAEYREAMARAAKQAGPVRLRLTGLTLTPGSVLLCAEPVDDAAAGFAAALADELGAAGRFEADFPRDIWYASLVHFTGPPRHPAALVDWVGARRRQDLGASVHTRAHLVAWRFDGAQTVPETLGTVRLGSAARHAHWRPERGPGQALGEQVREGGLARGHHPGDDDGGPQLGAQGRDVTRRTP